jgi:hypothetical protein
VRDLEITVFDFLFVVLLVDLFIHGLQLNRTNRDYLEVGTAFRAGDDFSFIDLIFVDVEVGFTFRTMNHKGLHSIKKAPLIIFSDSGAEGQVLDCENLAGAPENIA